MPSATGRETRAMKTLRLVAVLAAVSCLGGCFEINVPNFRSPDVDVDVNPPDNRRPPDNDRSAGRARGRKYYTANFGGYDSLAHVDKPVDLAAWLICPRTRGPVGGVRIGFYLDGKLAARATTDLSGIALATWIPPEAGTYHFSVRVLAVPKGAEPRLINSRPAGMIVCARRPRDPIVLVDLDHCVFSSRARRIWLGSTKAKAGAAAAVSRIDRRFAVVYMTRSGDELSPGTRSWLQDNGFQPGPVLLAQSPPTFGDARRYKSARLNDVLGSFPNTVAAVCGKEDSAQAFAARGVTTFLLTHLDDDDDPEDLREDARKIAAFDRRLNIVTRWDQVAQGILAGLRYPPATLARQLNLQASRLERHKKRDE